MLVSVVIPAYNMAAYIGEAIESLLNQTYKSLEIIVIDDGSIDSTAEIVRRYPVRYVKQANAGPSVAKNHGLLLATGDYIAVLDADDRSHPERIARQVAFLDENPKVGIVFTDHRNFNSKGPARDTMFETCPRLSTRMAGKDLAMHGAEAGLLMLDENCALPSASMFRRSVLPYVPGYTSDFRIGEDWHFAYQISKHFDIGFIRFVGTERRGHDNNVSSDQLRFHTDRVTFCRALMAIESRQEHASKLRWMLRQAMRSLCRLYSDRGETLRAFGYAIAGRTPRLAVRTVMKFMFPRSYMWGNDTTSDRTD